MTIRPNSVLDLMILDSWLASFECVVFCVHFMIDPHDLRTHPSYSPQSQAASLLLA